MLQQMLMCGYNLLSLTTELGEILKGVLGTQAISWFISGLVVGDSTRTSRVESVRSEFLGESLYDCIGNEQSCCFGDSPGV